MPLAAARRPNAAGIERVGDHAKGREPGSLDRPDNRQDIGRKLIGRGTVRRVRLHGRLGRSRIAELGARSFLRCEGGLSPGGNQSPLFLGERRVKMQHERVRVGAELGNDERHPLRHQPRNEMHVSGEAIELRNYDRTFRLASLRKRAAELGTTVESVGALAGFDLDMLAYEIDPFGLGEALDSGLLGLDPQSALALSGRGNQVVSDCADHRGPSRSRSLIYLTTVSSLCKTILNEISPFPFA